MKKLFIIIALFPMFVFGNGTVMELNGLIYRPIGFWDSQIFDPAFSNAVYQVAPTGGGGGSQGPQGPAGEAGANGTNATVTVTNTVTLDPGEDAAVENLGDSLNAILQFSIPRGEKGDTGETGATGATGEQGPAGQDGADGTNGVDGAAATISVGTVTTGSAGSSATVVNSGTSSAAVLDFSIPRGDKGDKGDKGDTGDQGPQGEQGEQGPAGADGATGATGATGPGYAQRWARIEPTSQGTNFLIDVTNNLGALMRHKLTIIATNAVNLSFNIQTNAELSLEVFASGGNRGVSFATNAVTFYNTNNSEISGTIWTMTVTNSCLFAVVTNEFTGHLVIGKKMSDWP